jgi:hypothetical protein
MAPDLHLDPLRVALAHRHLQLRHVRRRHEQRRRPELRRDQRHLRHRPLRQERTLRVDEHEPPIVERPQLIEPHCGQVQPATRLDRIDVK